MDFDEIMELQAQGARSRALGAAEFDNPFLKIWALPEATGTPHQRWLDMRDAWHFGWVVEDAFRGSRS